MTVDVDHWRSVILAAKSRPAAKKALRCTFKELKDFRAQHMPEHQWPDPRKGEDIAREQHAARERKRDRQAELVWMQAAAERQKEISREPTENEIEAAILMLNPRQMTAMEAYMPGIVPRGFDAVYSELRTLGLIQTQLRPSSKANLVSIGGYLFTPLGRAVQHRLRET